ncbi:MAG: asparagine synthetase B [Planctomycetaceae bacterium]|nr:MAG: asparagine synthetase B [Planctomycetaceae bacterium]
MCGLAGLVGRFDPGLMSRMNYLQRHRGPDGCGVYEESQLQAALGHVRLAILDLSDAAAQPMLSANGRYVLAYNGEIYNFRELRRELELKGYRFRSRGDTEVLLYSWQEWETRAPERWNGMFAVAIWDRWKRQLWLIRDPFGVKPLYYYQFPDGALIFASEIRAVLGDPNVPREIDFVSMQQHLTLGHTSGTRTLLKRVERLAPGTGLHWSAEERQCRLFRYASCSASTPHPAARQRSLRTTDLVAECRHRLATAIQRQLVADVPVGIALSGGLDSSLLACLAKQQGSTQLTAFAVSIQPRDNRLDQAPPDLPYARLVAQHSDIRLEEIELHVEQTTLWRQVLQYLDEPIVDPAILSSYLVCAAAREAGVPVLLSGQGADELQAGYPRYRAVAWTQSWEFLPRSVRRWIARAADRLPGSWSGPLGGLLRRGRRLLRELPCSSGERFLRYAANTPEDIVQSVLHPDIRQLVHREAPMDDCRAYLSRSASPGLEDFLARDQQVYLPNHNLTYTDRTSMAVGVECRVPFLDLELTEFLNHLPAHYKLRGQQTKWLLRRVAREVVPQEILRRPKAGFTAPYRTWLAEGASTLWSDVMHPEQLRRRGWFVPEVVQRLRQQSLQGQADWFMLQWGLLTIELWAQYFLDRPLWNVPTQQLPFEQRVCVAVDTGPDSTISRVA